MTTTTIGYFGYFGYRNRFRSLRLGCGYFLLRREGYRWKLRLDGGIQEGWLGSASATFGPHSSEIELGCRIAFRAPGESHGMDKGASVISSVGGQMETRAGESPTEVNLPLRPVETLKQARRMGANRVRIECNGANPVTPRPGDATPPSMTPSAVSRMMRPAAGSVSNHAVAPPGLP